MEFPYASHIVRDAVSGVLIGADVHTDDARMRTPIMQPAKRCIVAFIVEAKPVDHRIVLDKSKNSRFGIAGLCQWRERSDFGKAKTEPEQGIWHLGIFVKSCSHTKWIREAQAGDSDTQRRIVVGYTCGHEACLQCFDRETVRIFWVECKQHLAANRSKQSAHACNSGNWWLPSLPSGKGLTHRTTSSGNDA